MPATSPGGLAAAAALLQDCPELPKYVDALVEAREAKSLSRDAALDMLADLNMFGAVVGWWVEWRG